jgi:hypothetical protein
MVMPGSSEHVEQGQRSSGAADADVVAASFCDSSWMSAPA